jgi:hypothetical protein
MSLALAAIRARVGQTEDFWRTRIGGYLAGVYSPQKALPARAVLVVPGGSRESGCMVGFVAGHRSQRFD